MTAIIIDKTLLRYRKDLEYMISLEDIPAKTFRFDEVFNVDLENFEKIVILSEDLSKARKHLKKILPKSKPTLLLNPSKTVI